MSISVIMQNMDCGLIVKAKYILTMENDLPILEDGFLAIVNDKIAAIDSQKNIEKYQAKKFLDAGNSILMPGLVNTHAHAAMAYFRGIADDLPLADWLTKHIWPAEAKYVNQEFVHKASELACLEMLKAGITCFNDMYFFEEETAKVASRAGMRACVGEGILDFPTPSSKNADEALKKTEEMAQEYKDNELISVALAPHSVYACSGKNLLKAKALADKYALNLHIHISETERENADCLKQNNASPIKYLDKLGILSERTLAAHCVWLSADDIKILAKRGVKISHCAISNMKLGSGIMDYKKMQAAGLVISLGTDGVASNNTADLFLEMRVCALLHKVNSLNPENAPAMEIIRSATINGAKALGLDKKIGSLAVGKKADIITINLDKPHLAPVYNPYSHLAYAINSADVENVIINGKIIMQNRKVLNSDEKKILFEAQAFQLRIKN